MDNLLINGMFWDRLAYPGALGRGPEYPPQAEAWVTARAGSGRWPEFVACVAYDGDEQLAPAVRAAIDRMVAVVERSLVPNQREIVGFAHGSSLYFGGRSNAIADRLTELSRILTEAGIPNTIGLGFPNGPGVLGLAWATQRAIIAMRQKVRSGAGRLYVYDDAILAEPVNAPLFWLAAGAVNAAVKSGDAESVASALRQVADGLFRGPYVPLKPLRVMIQCQIVFIAQAALEVGVDPGTVARLGDTLQETVSEAFDYVRLEQLLYEAGARCCGLVAERYATSSNRLAAAADAYIEAHLSDADLGLAQIASYLGVSPSHLSRTYNRAVGCGITRTVNVRRVEAAKRRLIDSRDESVTQVAFDLGFGSVQHFGRAFREIAGVSPSEFRRAKIAR